MKMEGGSQRDASGRTTLNAGAEFRRAYLILCFFAVVLVLAFAGTNWDNPGSGSGLAAAGPTADGATEWADSPDSSGDLAALEAVLAAAEKGEERERAPAKPAVSRAEDGPEEEGDLERPPPTTKTTAAPKAAKKKKKVAPKAPPSDALDFTQPQHVCPGSPTTKSLGQGAPRQNKEVLYRILEKLGDGEVPETTTDMKLIKSGNFGFTKIECPFLTRDCASEKTYTGRQAAQKMKQTGAKWNETAQNFVDLKPGSLGSCALIGNSENMLKYNFGAAIDAHDTVIRHNTPIGKYARHVGKKATIVWVKGTYKGGGSASASMAYLLPKNVDELPKNFKKNGKPILIRGIGAKPLDKTKRLLYYLQGANLRRKHPTGGYSRPLNIIASKLCTRVDLYGFGSRNSSGKYFKKSAKVRPAHMMSFEHWTFRFMMSKGKLCVYGE